MSAEKNHDRAKQLLRAAQVESIPAEQQRWLDDHLATCTPCTEDARAIADAINSVRTVAVSAPPDVVRRASLAVHQRADQRRRKQESITFLAMAVVASVLWAIVVTPYAFTTFSRFGQMLHLSGATFVSALLLLWFLPATVLGAAAAWLRGEKSSDWVTGENRRQS
jgi:hypothetical protein